MYIVKKRGGVCRSGNLRWIKYEIWDIICGNGGIGGKIE